MCSVMSLVGMDDPSGDHTPLKSFGPPVCANADKPGQTRMLMVTMKQSLQILRRFILGYLLAEVRSYITTRDRPLSSFRYVFGLQCSVKLRRKKRVRNEEGEETKRLLESLSAV